MPKPDRKPDPDFEPDYDTADVEYDDALPTYYHEVADIEYETPADPDYDDIAQGSDEAELADPDYEEVPQVPALIEPEPVVMQAASTLFAFEVGRAVLPLTQALPHTVVWRGYLKEPHPVTGLLRRVPVYRLADGYWDCYREEELQVA
ncbi:hypothetical protein FNT36_05445 [Hymenobacter setariae]|uniref:Uncharacterized protein n=1 Tax=Hymenobacter setariae TaxID=2594794 RepID=A0A558C4G4_9BACT|nr:hypothetical protein [Hymenobacter setariae]TVT43532.1 hypothetical protein FNT36_05445 [Hymenobacter setariae]